MKKLLIIAAAAAVLVSCESKPGYVALGTINGFENLPEEAVMVVKDAAKGTTDTLKAAAEFTLTGDIDKTSYITVSIPGPDGKRMRGYAVSFVPDKDTITIELVPTGAGNVKGGEVNDVIAAMGSSLNSAQMAMMQAASTLEQAGKMDDEVMEKLYNEHQAKVKEIALETFNDNKDNYAALQALQLVAYDLTLEEIEPLLASAPAFVKNDKSISKIYDNKKAFKATAEGSAFVDFEGKTPDGKAVKLSDYVGQGKWTLVDFWASWCGPCMREIPNIKTIYETYASKGLTVLGVAVWDGDNSKSLARMTEKEMFWSQIFCGEDTTPTDSYGILGIPHIILFAPDGTIYKRDLRGEEMINTVEEVMSR